MSHNLIDLIECSPARLKAREVLDRLLDDPNMWATHGCPPLHKLRVLEDEFTKAFESHERPHDHV